MPVSSTRPDYDIYVQRWRLVRDIVDSNISEYICDVDEKDKIRNNKYKLDAQFTNFTARTKYGLVGAVFRRDLISELPEVIKYLDEDATGYHMTLNKLSQEVTGEVLQCGRYGLLVDYPATQGGLTQKEVSDKNLKARIYRYKAESIINWNTEIDNGIPKVTLIVLKECKTSIDEEDGFKWLEEDQFRVLRLLNGQYVQQLYDKNGELVSEYTPLDNSGNSWDIIPFVFVGSEDNDSEIDTVPLYDLSKLNIGHLKNSADYEESIHIVGQPTLILSTDLTDEQFRAANPDGIKIGARKGHNLGVGGKAEFLQANPNQLADEAMKRKEQQAVMIGARLISAQADRETAVAAQMRHSGETSILWTIAKNVEESLTRCCKYILRFMGDSSQEDMIQLTINTVFFEQTVDPNLIMAEIQLMSNGLLSKEDVRQFLKRQGLIEENRTDEQIEQDIANDPKPVGLNPNSLAISGKTPTTIGQIPTNPTKGG